MGPEASYILSNWMSGSEGYHVKAVDWTLPCFCLARCKFRPGKNF